MGIYENNLAALVKGQPQAQLVEEKAEKNPGEEYTFRMEQAVNGLKFPVVGTPQGDWQLNSRYDPELAAREYARRYEKLRPYEKCLVFGLSDGRALRRMLAYGDETNAWIVYEPSRELFQAVLREIDLTDLLIHPHVYLVVDSVEVLKRILKAAIKYNNATLLQHCILPGYDVLFHDACEMTINEMVMQVEYSCFSKNTVQDYHREFALCGIQCMADALCHSNVYQMRKYFQEKKVCDLPVIIVAAGPSLNKNIEELKEAKGKAFIMVVDAALRAMESHGICPDLALSVDAKVRDEFFQGVNIEKMALFLSTHSNPSLIQAHKGRHFYDTAPNDLFASYARQVSDNQYVFLGNGGSVSTAAYCLALYLGFRTIIFVGQDLAFTDGQSYHKELVKDEKSNQEYIESRERVVVEDQQGNPIETDYQMDLYRRWLEKEIAGLPEGYQVIDATEGGARIAGTTILPLRDAIVRLCQRKVDFAQLLQEVPGAYNEQQQCYISEGIQKEPDRLRSLAAVTEEGVQYAKELDAAFQRQDEGEQRRLLGKIQQINQKIQSEPVQDLLLYYNSKTEYEVAEDIYTENLTVSQLCEKYLKWYSDCKSALLAIAEDLEQVL
ncbi:MAG: motility associated factor glycosyltransferase family protein [Roseburia sp.]